VGKSRPRFAYQSSPESYRLTLAFAFVLLREPTLCTAALLAIARYGSLP